jgi:hypothetical protein
MGISLASGCMAYMDSEMNIESQYLVVYEKKGKQRLMVLGRAALLDWQRKNKNYKVFTLTQCHLTEAY